MGRDLPKILPDFWREQLENVQGREKGVSDLEFSLDMLSLGAFKTCKQRSQNSPDLERTREDHSEGAGGGIEAHRTQGRGGRWATMSYTFERSS